MATPTLFALLTALSTVRALNDWSQPCFDGVCEYSLPSGSSSGSLKIWGSPNAISDITPAAGWDIIDCQPDSITQEIRLVCTGNDADCDNLYQSVGAVNKIVRLPESCGSNAFARVARAWTPTDQSVPARLARRQDPKPVRALALDTDFAAAEGAEDVNFIVQAANVPGAEADLAGVIPTPARMSRMRRGRKSRAFFDFIQDALDVIANALVNKIDISEEFAVLDAEFDETRNLLDESLDCPPISAKLTVDVSAKGNVVAAIGVVASGTLIPPKIDDFAVTANVDASFDGALDLMADVTGTFDSGKIQIFTIGIPGFDIPGILTIGPSFDIDAQAVAELDIALDLSVGLSYAVSSAVFVFPPGKDDSTDGGAFDIVDTPLKLTLAPNINATGTIEAHLIPSLNLGISALGDSVKAAIFLELDASAKLALELEAGAVIEVESEDDEESTTSSSEEDTMMVRRHASPAALIQAARLDERQSAEVTDTNFGGCISLSAALDVNVGAEGSFFGLFDESVEKNLFSKEFEIFEKCFGDRIKRRSVPMLETSLTRRQGLLDLLCSAEGAAEDELTVVDETISSSDLQ